MRVKGILGGLALALCIGTVAPVSVFADDTVHVNYVNTHESAIKGLSEQNQLIAKEAKKQILEIAEGKRSDAILRINVKDVLGMDVNDEKYDATLSELGLSKNAFDENGVAKTYNPSVAWQAWAEKKGYFGYYNNGDWKKINHALWEECSYELFWHDKVKQGIAAWPVSIYLKENGKVGMTEESFVPLVAGIRSDYQGATSKTDIYDSYYTGIGQTTNVDVTKTAKVTADTIPNVMAVVEQYKDLSDMEKLTAYRDYILDAVTYDNTAASLIGKKVEPSDAFFVNNVFDNDPKTNVVCEGYAKAFKLLCDLSTFEDSTIDVKLVTGKLTSQVIATASGDHMWNVVTMDGKNYITDLTNSDGEKSSYDKLFMVAAKDYYGDYRVETSAGNYTFSYKESDGNNYNDSYLAKDLEITSSVAKKANSWKTALSMTDVVEGDKVEPKAEAAYGTVKFLYATAKDGEYTETVPSAVGTYWVKAVVAEGEEYKGLESDPVSFKITERVQKTNSWTEEFTVADVAYGTKLAVSAKAAYGEVKFQYATSADGTFKEEAPENVGTYYVKAIVTETGDYTALESAAKSFQITKAANSWKTALSVKDITEGLKPAPTAVAAFGKVSFQYSTNNTSGYTETVPTKAGTYYVKAVVAETDNYAGIESDAVSFKITAKVVDPATQVPYVNEKDSSAVNLNEQQMKIFKEARRQIREIAAGERAYAILEINVADTLGLDVNDTKYNASLSTLGLSKSDFDANGKGSIDAGVAWQNWAENKGYFDYYTKGGASKLNKALWYNCAYDLYWHDRSVAWWPITVSLKDDGTVGMTADSYIPGAFAVSSDYRASENTKDEYRQYYIDHPEYGAAPNWDVDANKAKSTAKTTIANAKKVVEAAKKLSDYEKLEYYADYILKAVSYDSEAAKHIGDTSYGLGNPWQVPYVFDNNSSTNIVCEGYAKAFKFLCDMTTFEDSTIDVNLATGTCSISEGYSSQTEEHMWNVVCLNGKNYIVDLTNSDEGGVGEVGTLFMMPASKGYAGNYNLNGIYYPSAGGEGQSASRTSWNASYKYDDDTNAAFASSALEIAKELPNNYADAKEAAADIAKQMKARKSRIVVQFTGSSSGLKGDTFTALRDLAYEHTGEAGLGDNLKRQVGTCVPATSGSTNVYIYNVEYYNNAAAERRLETEAKKVIDSLKLEGKSDYQKAKAIYNWLCRNVDYDEANEGNMSDMSRYSAYAAIVLKNCVCSGYANSFYYLACMAGLENRIVVSKDHAWNIVKLGEYYYNVDATWDAGYYDPDAGYSASYAWRFFMKNEATYLQDNYPTTQWGTVNGEHHTRLSYDTGDAEFRKAYPVSPTNYGETESGILFKEDNGKVNITGYKGEATDLTVPDQIAGESVGTIKAKALADEKLTKIKFTSDVDTIENGAFNKNVTLELDSSCKNLIKYAQENNIKILGISEPQAENSWTKALTCADINVGETPAPKAEAKYGEVTYKYAAEKDGAYTETVPTEAGTYYVKAYVEETEKYKGLESDAVEFKINKATVTEPTEVEELQKQLDASKEELAKVTEEKETAEAKAKEAEAAKAEAEAKVAKAEEAQKAAEAAKAEADKKLEETQNDLTKSEEEKAAAKAAAETAKAEADKAKADLEVAKAETAKAETAKAEAEAEAKAKEAELTQVKADKAELETKLAAAEGNAEAVAKLNEELDAAKKAAEEAKAKEAKLNEELKAAKEANEAADKQLSEAKDKLTAANTELDAAKENLAKAEKALEEAQKTAETEKAELQKQLDASKEELTKVTEEKEAAEAKAKEADEAKAAAEAKVVEAEKAKEAAEAAKVEADKKLEETQNDLTKSEEEKAAAKAAAETAKAEADKAKADLDVAKAETAKAETAKAEAEAEAKAKEAELTQVKADKAELETKLAAAEGNAEAVAKLNEELDAAKKAAEEAKAKEAKLNEELKAAKEANEAADKELSEAKDKLTAANTELDAAKENLAKAEKDLKEAQDKTKVTEAEKAELQQKLDASKEELTKVTEEKAAAEAKAKEAEAAQKKAETEKAKAEKAQKDAEAAKDAADEELAKVQNDLTKSEEEKAAVKAAAEKAERDLAAANAELKEAEAAKDAAVEDKAKAEAEAKAKDAELAKANEANKALELELAAAKGDAEAVTKLTEELAEAKEAAKAAKANEEKLNKELSEAKEAKEKAEADLKAAQDEKAEVLQNNAKEVAKLQKQIEEAKKTAEGDSEALAKLNAELAKAKEELEAIQAKLADAEKRLADAEKTNTDPAHKHTYSAWKTISKATVFVKAKQQRTCSCGEKETRSIGSVLKPTIKLNAKVIPLKVKQSTTKVKVSGLARGDSIKSWRSSNTKIVKVDRRGKITAGKKKGTANIIITLASGKTAALKVKVQNTAVKTSKITNVAKKATLKVGKKLNLKPVITPITTLEKVQFATSSKQIATVSKKGVITAKKAGKVKITVKSGKKKVTMTITVKK